MKQLLIISFVIIYVMFGSELGYSKISSLHTHFTYVFQHANVFHLIVNSLSFLSLYKAIKGIPAYRFLSVSYIIAVIASFLSEKDIPTIGASGLIYSMAGVFFTTCIIGRRMCILDKKLFYFTIMCTVISLLAGFIGSSTNNVCHVISLLLGSVYAVIDDKLYK